MEILVKVVVEDEEDIVEVDEVLIRWRVTGVGCVAIWPVTVPNMVMHKVLAQPVLKMHNHSDLGVEAQGEVEDGRSGLKEWV